MTARGHGSWDTAGPQGWAGHSSPCAGQAERGPSARFLGKATAPLCGFLAGNRYLRWVFEELGADPTTTLQGSVWGLCPRHKGAYAAPPGSPQGAASRALRLRAPRDTQCLRPAGAVADM